MKTIEERANEYWQDKYPYLSGMYMRDAIKTVFTESATGQCKIDIDKACKWLYKNQKNYDYINVDGDVYDLSLILDFKKYMEEGL